MKLNLESLRLGDAFKLTMRTLPILGVRLAANLVFWLVLIIYLGITGGIAYLVGQAVEFLGVIIFIVALIGIAPLYQLAKRYVLYMIKAAHIAVVSELLASGDLPPGVSQLQWGKERVEERFGEASAMFVIDEMVSSIVRSFTNTVYRMASWLPGETFRNLARVVERIVKFALTYVDEAILARAFWLHSETVWANARDGVVLYGMAWQPLLLNAVALMLLSYLPFIVAMIIFAAPIGALMSLISTNIAGWSVIAVLSFSYLVKMAVGDGFAMTAIIAAYRRETEGLEPDPGVVAKLDSLSAKFGELTQRAQEELASLGRKKGQGAEAASPDTPQSTDTA